MKTKVLEVTYTHVQHQQQQQQINKETEQNNTKQKHHECESVRSSNYLAYDKKFDIWLRLRISYRVTDGQLYYFAYSMYSYI